MAANTIAFALTSAAYQDVSGGYTTCSFRLPLISSKNNVIHVYIGTSLPAVDTADFDEFMAPQQLADEWQCHFTDLETARVYVKAGMRNATASNPVNLKVYRK